MLRGNGVTRRVGVIGHIFVVLVRFRSVGVVVLENGVEARIAGPLGIIGIKSRNTLLCAYMLDSCS